MSLPDHCHRLVRIEQVGDLLVARGIAGEFGAAASISATEQERFSLILTELATNLIRYAPDGGVMLMRPMDGRSGLECICYDRGPGIQDVAASMRDGESVGSGLGFGLGAVRRLSDEFAIHSEPAIGTAILARVRAAGAAPADARSGAVMLPMAGLDDCGDGWLVRADNVVVVIDGLGHGPEASDAARRAEASAAAGDGDPVRVIEAMHAALHGTRGAVVMAVVAGPQSVRFAGVGNVSGTVIGVDKQTRLHSCWGVVGSKLPQGVANQIAWSAGDVLLLHTDGIARANEIFSARHLRYVEPTLAAAIVTRDATTKLDDQTVVVIRR